MSKKKPKARSPGKLETAIQQSLSKVSVKKLVAMNIPYLIAFYVVEKCAWLYRHCIGGTVVQKLGVMLMNLPVAFRSWIPSFHIRDLLAGIIGALLLRCVVYMKGKNAKKFRQGEEYGSARWGNEKDIEPFIDYFVKSLNNDASNQIIVCPNHHSIIHDVDPVFDRGRLLYIYSNGFEEKLVLNQHL